MVWNHSVDTMAIGLQIDFHLDSWAVFFLYSSSQCINHLSPHYISFVSLKVHQESRRTRQNLMGAGRYPVHHGGFFYLMVYGEDRAPYSIYILHRNGEGEMILHVLSVWEGSNMRLSSERSDGWVSSGNRVSAHDQLSSWPAEQGQESYTGELSQAMFSLSSQIKIVYHCTHITLCFCFTTAWVVQEIIYIIRDSRKFPSPKNRHHVSISSGEQRLRLGSGRVLSPQD